MSVIWHELIELVEAQMADAEPWQTAELHLLDNAFSDHLSRSGIQPSPEAAATLMAAAVFLSIHTPEWGGEARETLGELAGLGLRLLERSITV